MCLNFSAWATRTSNAPTALRNTSSRPRMRPSRWSPVLHAYFARVLVYQTLQDRSKAQQPRPCGAALRRARLRAGRDAFSSVKVERVFGYLRDADKKAKGRSNATNGRHAPEEAVFRFCTDL